MRRAVLFLVLLLAPACAGPLGRTTPMLPGAPAAPGSPENLRVLSRCQALNDRHSLWASLAQGSGVLAGASGVSSLPLHDESSAARVGVAAGALVFGALAAFSVSMSSSASESWSRECSGVAAAGSP